MAIEEAHPQTKPAFQPRLRPKPALPSLSGLDGGFEDALANAGAQSPERAPPDATARPDAPVTASQAQSPAAGGMRESGPPATRMRSEVRGAVIRPDSGVAAIADDSGRTASAGMVRAAVAWPAGNAGSGQAADAPRTSGAQASGAQASIQTSKGQASGQAGSQATAGAASSQFTDEDVAALQAWAAAVKAPSRPHATAKSPPLEAAPSLAAMLAAADPDSLAVTASAQLGKRYTPGGENPRQGFDCSGLTSYVYAKSGVELSRSSREQFRQGQPVKREDLRKGDLVFFGKKGVHHVGIYMEDGKFVHAATSGGAVKVGSLDDPEWSRSYAGARRVIRDDASGPVKSAGLSATG